MNKLLRQAGIQEDDLLIVSDVDEIPRAEVVELFQKCQGMPDIVQLDMTMYIYSFGFQNLLSTWKAAIHRYKVGHFSYSHGLQSYYRLKGTNDESSEREARGKSCEHMYSSFFFSLSLCFILSTIE